MSELYSGKPSTWPHGLYAQHDELASEHDWAMIVCPQGAYWFHKDTLEWWKEGHNYAHFHEIRPFKRLVEL